MHHGQSGRHAFSGRQRSIAGRHRPERDAKRGPIGQKRTVVDLKRALSKPLTKAVILQIQESVGTRADGIIGPKTVQAVAELPIAVSWSPTE